MMIAQITDMHVRAPDGRCNGFIDTNAYLERAVDGTEMNTHGYAGVEDED